MVISIHSNRKWKDIHWYNEKRYVKIFKGGREGRNIMIWLLMVVSDNNDEFNKEMKNLIWKILISFIS